ncbi:hypothetical protein GOC73_28710 [Sinorhizobium medicae]|uniref:hypothetical protein n=1 Tax=Sinorhizobium medicae TaxID=110321 RepID=UPI00035FF967|nr:hypothetical protein [Sinorhizobium medicae]MDX0408361.1 hypothetical protein [Sinorhizobium medicae]MDX0420312.1 hypothetical protein [Sinorhizobium medicae]MDX0439453.1 hypothetical protein [Sinorhizobium medicae]MDX0463583.1 hypothetical protein [Sinorhizobium medicae]MDX0537104.1 hypothetical protein [Sinorhizobium medicae]
MKRRSFLLALISAPFVPAATSAVVPTFERSPLEGVMRLATADIGTSDAGRLRARNGKMKIDLNNGTIEIFS